MNRRVSGAGRGQSNTRFTGSMRFVYIHLVVFGAWILINSGVIGGVPRFDPSFVVLAMVASVEAIFLSTFVLISQNRMAALADKRADLDLQVSLLAEHEITRVIALVTAMAERMGIENAAHDPRAWRNLSQDVAPEKVMEKMEAHKAAVQNQASGAASFLPADLSSFLVRGDENLPRRGGRTSRSNARNRVLE